jgi:hypothetical protein
LDLSPAVFAYTTVRYTPSLNDISMVVLA